MHVSFDAAEQLTDVQSQVAYLEQQLSNQQHLAQTYIAEQREDFAGRARAVLLEQKQEFEAQATVYQELAREVASAELGQQRQELDHSHRESIAQISCHVQHEEAVARTNLFAVNQALTDTDHCHRSRGQDRNIPEGQPHLGRGFGRLQGSSCLP